MACRRSFRLSEESLRRDWWKITFELITDYIRSLIEFYPKHAEKEDRQFFIPCMDYFTDAEKEAMLKEEWEFDKSLIHEKYRNRVIALEKILTPKKL